MKHITRYVTNVCLLASLIKTATATSQNISCYQCVRSSDTECGEHELLPCSPVYDRCVIHMSKDVERGFLLKRECGLGPCSFDDNMASRGLGWDGCDRTKDAFFCVSCCKGNGCNKSSSSSPEEGPRLVVVAVCLLAVIMLEIFKGFQPPYLPDKERL